MNLFSLILLHFDGFQKHRIYHLNRPPFNINLFLTYSIMDNKLILIINMHNNTLQRLFQKNYPKIKNFIRNKAFNTRNNANNYKK